MTEREKMLAGEPYQSRDPELLVLYHRTKALLGTFASTASTDSAGKQEILRSMFGSLGSGVWIENVLVGPAVQLYTASHPLLADERIVWGEKETERRYVTRALPMSIVDCAWIGGGAIVMPGVTIGRRTTIGAGSVVTGDIPECCFAAGNPCRVIRAL